MGLKTPHLLLSSIMSGIEVAGLVLGAIPVLISGIESYANGVSKAGRMIRYKRELKSLHRTLETDYELYRTICRLLLSQIADPGDIAELLDEPGGEAWKDPDLAKAMRRLLGSSYDVYVKTMEDMDAAVKEFNDRLRLGPDGKVHLNRRISNSG